MKKYYNFYLLLLALLPMITFGQKSCLISITNYSKKPSDMFYLKHVRGDVGDSEIPLCKNWLGHTSDVTTLKNCIVNQYDRLFNHPAFNPQATCESIVNFPIHITFSDGRTCVAKRELKRSTEHLYLNYPTDFVCKKNFSK